MVAAFTREVVAETTMDVVSRLLGEVGNRIAPPFRDIGGVPSREPEPVRISRCASEGGASSFGNEPNVPRRPRAQ